MPTKPQKRKRYTQMAIDVDMVDEEIKIFIDDREEPISVCYFMFDGPMIRVTDIETSDGFKRSGYGHLMMNILKMISIQHKMPIYLWALDEAIPFYESIGFKHLDDPEVQKNVFFANITDERHLHKNIDHDDFIYIPKSLKGRATIYI